MAKADLLAEAESLGLDLPKSTKVADLEKAIAKARKSDPNTAARVASPSHPCPLCGRINPHVHALD